MTDAEFLDDLSARIMAIPVKYDVDQRDVFRLIKIAGNLRDAEKL